MLELKEIVGTFFSVEALTSSCLGVALIIIILWFIDERKEG